MVLCCSNLPAWAGLYLWAWDRAEDLRWVESGVGIAYFAAQLDARERGLSVSWRRPPLHVRPDTPLLPVLHIEAFAPRVPRILDEDAAEIWAQTLVDTVLRTGSRSFQIDFEARGSQKLFYASVLQRIRHQLPDHWISITALASWCSDEQWLTTLPVNEIVPMYFRMGPTERQLWRTRLLVPHKLPKSCRAAAGMATDELADVQVAHGRGDHPALSGYHWYLFSPQPWKPDMLEPYRRWRALPASTQ